MLRRLNLSESTWIEKMLSVRFEGNEILKKQIDSARIKADYNSGFISLKFSLKSVQRFSEETRVPIQMLAYQNDGIPIIFVLHVINGYIDELEVFDAAGNKMKNDINLDKVEWIIAPELPPLK